MGEMTVQTDKSLSNMSLGVAADLEESDQEKSLRWLLDMDLSEPQETLFTVAGNDYFDAGLSAFEAEVAGRPLVRGNARSDDLATYIDEEIVISSTGSGNDIYHRNEQSSVLESPRNGRNEQVMALDFSRVRDDVDAIFTGDLSDGADILGLTVCRPHSVETTALGAAMLAAAGAGLYPALAEAVDAMRGPSDSFTPAIEAGVRDERLARWQDALERLL